MKKIFNLMNLCLVAACLLTFTACSNENGEGENANTNTVSISPAKTPDFILYSAGTVFNSGTRADMQVNVNYFKIQDFGGGKSDWMKQNYPVLYQYFDNAPTTTDRSEQVSTDEYNYVIDYIKNHPDEGGTECDLTTYFIQNVGSSNDNYTLEFKNGESIHHTQNVTGGNQMDYFVIGGSHVNDYNAHWGPRALCVNIPVVSPTYHDSYANLTIENAYKFYYIEYNGKTNCYLCFDYRTNKYDNGQCDFQGDGVYNDWVIKLSPADGSNAIDPSKKSDDPVVVGEGQVEVNLSVNSQKEPEAGDYIATKLSIHIRANSDVEVFIPVPAEYYCAADDMDIVLSHKLEIEAYKASNSQTMTYDINGNSVSFTATYELDGIRITTSGINEDIINYTKSNYGDGVTFEIWNYFKDNITRAELKPYLDASTVTFTSSANPLWYVNAFARLNNAKNEWDCTVSPTSNYEKVKENDGVTTYNYNSIYKKK